MVTEHQVRERAYYIWEDEGRCLGRADAHWFQAQAELQASGTDAPLSVQPVAADTSAAASPAKSLMKKSAAKPAATKTKPAAKVAAKPATAARKSSRAAAGDAIGLH